MRIIGTIILVAVMGLAAQAQAKQQRVRAPAQPPVEMEQVVVAPVCPRLCNTDVSPCDPPEFKRADGRCNMGAYSGGFN